jgi:hypothetical protein
LNNNFKSLHFIIKGTQNEIKGTQKELVKLLDLMGSELAAIFCFDGKYERFLMDPLG